MNDLIPGASSSIAPAPPTAHLLGNVQDDWEAIEVWLAILAARPVSPATLATYRREQRRLYWYCTRFGVAPLRNWTYQEVAAYLSFLRKRVSEFACPPGLRPDHADWTPFRKGKLGESSIAATVRILNTLFSFWQEAGYRATNPFAAATRSPRTAENRGGRAVPPDALELVRQHMDTRSRRTARDHLTYWRNAFVLCLLERTGLRANELAQANMTDVHVVPDPKTARHYWALKISHQKGGGAGIVPLDSDVMQAFFRYRKAFELPEIPAYDEDYGLVLSPHTAASQDAMVHTSARARRGRTMWKSVRTRQSVWAIVRQEFDEAAKWVGAKSPEAAILRRASTHWLRHTRGTTLTLQGKELRLVAKAMRHKDPRTTMLYTDLDFLDVVRALDTGSG